MTHQQSFEHTLESVRGVLAHVLSDSGLMPENIHPDSSLIQDLGLDSLKFVDLTVALEDAFGFDEFPMQEWVDGQAAMTSGAFRVAALARACWEQRAATRSAGVSV